ncbi:MAG: 6,7-dimethyl-8-ribityllumazine synthase [Rhodobiaceae bacterium]|nr:6,7-dimethyl-8-ribityllumazine synthase [Rhodobiaceae bacterium]MCC0048700.1 6,7-dimethyl-8-ribityllumazine synthase [Rhodobiaceae bacterium]
MSDRLLIIESPYYREITDALKQGAMAAIEAAGATADTVEVPGVLEIPAALSMAVASVRRGQGPVYDGYVLLGCVIRGETSHYDIVANESARAVMDLSVEYQLAVGNGILTVNNGDQARVRADIGKKDKGGDAARAALAMISLRRCLAGLS